MSAENLPTRRVFIPSDLLTDPDSNRYILPTANGQGAVKIDLFPCYPVPQPLAMKLDGFQSVSHSFYNNARQLVFGHRGMGMTFKNLFYTGQRHLPMENTIDSFNAVAANGGDGIEFDVVITRDLVPLVYHDFHVALRVEVCLYFMIFFLFWIIFGNNLRNRLLTELIL